MSEEQTIAVGKADGTSNYYSYTPVESTSSGMSLQDQIAEAEVELAKWTQRLKKLRDQEPADPYADGKAACESGQFVHNNPHLPATSAWADWRSGWLDAKLHDRG